MACHHFDSCVMLVLKIFMPGALKNGAFRV